MATFQDNPDYYQRLGWYILGNGWNSLHRKYEVLEQNLEWFKKENYIIV